MDGFDPAFPPRLGLDLRSLGRRVRPVAVGRHVQLCRDEQLAARRVGEATLQEKVFAVIRSELNRGGLPFLYPRDLDRIMGDDIDLQQLYATLQGLRRRGVIELVPGRRGAMRLRPNAPTSIRDGRGRKRSSFARNW